MVHEWPRRALWMILVPKTMGLRCLRHPGTKKRRGGLREEGRNCSWVSGLKATQTWGSRPSKRLVFPELFQRVLTRLWLSHELLYSLVQPRAAYFLRPIKYQHSNPGSKELTGNSWLEAYFLKIPSDPELYHKTESNQICRLVVYFLSCKQICVSLEFFSLPSKLSKSTFLAFGFFYLKFQQAKRNRKVVDKAYKR